MIRGGGGVIADTLKFTRTSWARWEAVSRNSKYLVHFTGPKETLYCGRCNSLASLYRDHRTRPESTARQSIAPVPPEYIEYINQPSTKLQHQHRALKAHHRVALRSHAITYCRAGDVMFIMNYVPVPMIGVVVAGLLLLLNTKSPKFQPCVPRLTPSCRATWSISTRPTTRCRNLQPLQWPLHTLFPPLVHNHLLCSSRR